MKPGARGISGAPGLMTAPAPEGFCDQALKGDIDFEGMRQKAQDEALVYYDTISTACGGEIPKLDFSWTEIYVREDGLDSNQKREAYHSQPALKILEKARKSTTDKEIQSMLLWVELDNLQCSRDQYGIRARNSALSTYAVIQNSQWNGRGQMCMFGESRNETVSEADFSELLNPLPDSTLLTVVDCHI